MNQKKDKDRLKKLRVFEKIIGYGFRDKLLLNQALTHKSYANEKGMGRSSDNERLEFLGDSVLGLIISHTLYNECPGEDEGILTRYKSQLVSGEMLARIARGLEIGEYLLLGKGEDASGGRRHVSNLMCALEAVIGAVFLDGGLRPSCAFIKKVLGQEIKLVKEGKGLKDYKSAFQQFALRKFKITPSYRVLSEIGPDHKKHFIVEAIVAGSRYGIGSGPNKKSAEQASAREALSALKPETE